MMVKFEESDMTFSFPEEDLYRIEKSELLATLQFKACECMVKKDNDILLLEAKSSSPRQDNSPEKFKVYIGEIGKKFSDSLLLYNAVLLRHKDEKMGGNLHRVDLRKAKYKLYLIISGHKAEWLPPLLNALKKELRTTLKLWQIEDTAIKVINKEKAQEYGIVQ
jgi:hypothetical protein